MRHVLAVRVAIGFLALAVMSFPLVTQAKKVWELDDTVRRQVGDIHLSMQKNFSRNAELGAFWANSLNTKTGVSAIFRGVCSEVIAVQVRASDTRKLDLAPFLQSRTGTNLPIDDVLEVLQEALSEQCEQLQVMRIAFSPAHHTNEDYRYEGTLRKANRWRIEDGKVATEYDGAYTFELNYRDVFSVGGVRYKGGCEKLPTLELGPQYANNSERALSELPDMSAYGFIATQVSPAYVAQCPDVTKIRYALNPMPEDYICREDGDCFLDAVLDDEWKVDTGQFKLKEYNNPISDVRDIYEVLAAGRFDILADYSSFFGFYLEAYFGAYSDHCSSHIKDPVGREIQSVERTYDSSGFLLKEEFGPVRKILIPRQYEDDFDRYFGSSRAWAAGHMLRSVVASKKRGRGPVDSVYRAVGFFTGNIDKLEGIVRGSCNSDRQMTAQANMINFARSQPAITGKFATNKKPQNKYPKNGSSAPAFSQAELAKRQAAAQKISDMRYKENAEKNAAKQAKIRAEIEARNAPRNSARRSAQRNNSRSRSPSREASPQPQNRTQQLADHSAKQAKIQEISQAHALAMSEAMKTYLAKIKSAKTNEERIQAQQEFQKLQLEKQQAVQQLIRELSGQ